MTTTFTKLSCVLLCCCFSAAFAQEDTEKSRFAELIVGTKWKYKGKESSIHFLTGSLVKFRMENGKLRTQGYKVLEKGVISWRDGGTNKGAEAKMTFSADFKTCEVSVRDVKKTALFIERVKLDGLGEGDLLSGNNAQFDNWLQKKTLVVDGEEKSLSFSEGVMLGFRKVLLKDDPCFYEVVEPGLIEFSVLGSTVEHHYIKVSSDLSTFELVANDVVFKGAVISSPEAPPLPDVVTEYYGKEHKTERSKMSHDEFAKWLVGTRWKQPGRRVIMTFVSEKSIHLENKEEGVSIAYGYRIINSRTGEVKLPWAGLNWNNDMLVIGESLDKAEWKHHDGAGITKLSLVQRANPPSLGKGKLSEFSKLEFEQWLQTQEFKNKGNNHLKFLPDGVVIGFWGDQHPDRTRYKVVVPGLVQMSWNREPERQTPFLIFSSDLKTGFLGTKWDSFNGVIIPNGKERDDVLTEVAPGFNLSELKGIEIKKQLATTQSLLLSPLGNSYYAAQASKLSLTAVKLQNSDAAKIRFNQEVGEMMSSSLDQVVRFHAIRNGGWPKGGQIEIAFAERYSGKDGPSAAVGFGLLIESMLTGTKLRTDVAFTGDMNADGTVQPIGGVSAKIRGAKKAGLDFIGVPYANRGDVLDMVVVHGVEGLKSTQIFGLKNFDEAIDLAKDEASSNSAQAIELFKNHFSGKGGTQPTSDAMRKVLEKAPNHLSARLLLSSATGNIPERLSVKASLRTLDQITSSILDATKSDLSSTSSLDAGKMGAVSSELKRLRPKVDNRIRKYCDAWVNWATLVDEILNAPTVNELHMRRLRSAITQLDAEQNSLKKNVGVQDELLR